ncbi:MAG TPA: hydrogenase maturation protease, partial [Anaerolinea sp.]|nr:hydrogenase maturation protease [Anaerolinea sp.]
MAVLGVGNELNGDDAAGVLAARWLKEEVKSFTRKPTGEALSTTEKSGGENVLVLEGGLAPENFTGVLRLFRPELLLLIDAVWFEGRPGAIIVLDGAQATGMGASTHMQPLSNLSQYLVK